MARIYHLWTCQVSFALLLLMMFLNLFRGMGAWRKTMDSHKLDNFQEPGPEVVERQRVVKKRAAQRVRSWTVKNEMRGGLSRMTTSAP